MGGAGEKEDMSLGGEEDDECARPDLDRCRGVVEGDIGVCSGLGALGEEALGQVVPAVLGEAAAGGRGGAGWLFDGEPGQQGLQDLFLVDLKVEGFADEATARPDDVVVGGDDVVGGPVGGAVRVGVPDIVAVGAVFAEDGFGDEVLQGGGPMDPD